MGKLVSFDYIFIIHIYRFSSTISYSLINYELVRGKVQSGLSKDTGKTWKKNASACGDRQEIMAFIAKNIPILVEEAVCPKI